MMRTQEVRSAKPVREILPSEMEVCIFVDNRRALYGTCHKDGRTIEEAYYTEIHRTPYGWFQGVYREAGQYYPVVFNRRGEECLMCSSLKKVEPTIYEAMWHNHAIRFDLHQKVIPKETIEEGGRTRYQISHNRMKLFVDSLELGAWE